MDTLQTTQTNLQNSDGVEITHFVWDDLPDEAYCGKDVSNERWVSDSVPVNCERCLEIVRLCEESED